MIEQMVLLGLAGFRLASLISTERGPFNVFIRFRERFGFTHDDEGKVLTHPGNTFARGLACMWCSSVWMTGLSWLAWQVHPVLVLLPAAASVAFIVEQVIRPAAREIRVLTDRNDGQVN
jgi:hypothetical protein